MKFLSISFALSMVSSAGRSAPFTSEDLPSKMIGQSIPIEQYVPYKGETSSPLFGPTINLKSASFDGETGDMLLEFAPIQQGGNIRPDTNLILDAHIGVTCNTPENDNTNTNARRRSRANDQVDGNYPAVAMTAMVRARKPLLVVNGGWIRRAVTMQNIPCRDDWEISILAGATVTHPGNGYKRVGRPLNKSIPTGIMNLKGGQNEYHKNKLKEKPRADEMKINVEMKSGRKPNRQNFRPRGRPQIPTAKILVHGYCANKNPFPIDHFTNSRNARTRTIEFSDPDGYRTNNWKNDEFAKKIARFADENGIEACNIIAHSQGGLAALHLYNYYWSCLDESEIIDGDGSQKSSRLIQSVGSPYQGTKLANVGNADIIGKIVGQGCGSNEDLTEKGARLWLQGISIKARSSVTYYTTSAGDYDSTVCSEETSFVLEGPNDGVVERQRGQLPGGNFGGHTKLQCHTGGLNGYLSQTRDIVRNQVMDRVQIASVKRKVSGVEL